MPPRADDFLIVSLRMFNGVLIVPGTALVVTAMANTHDRNTLSRLAALLLLAISVPQTVLARLPFAATSSLHFVDAIVAADNYRAAAGGLAMKKSPSVDVIAFSRILWQASIENTRRLKWVLEKHRPGVVLPSQVSPHYMFEIDQLVHVNGVAFDRRFVAMQTASLKETLALAKAYARLGDDFDLKEFAAATVPKLEMQLDRIRNLQRS